MSRKIFELVYPDGSKKHIDRIERDNLLLSGMAKQTSPKSYRFLGIKLTLHSLSDLRKISFTPTNLRRFLPGCFIFEYQGKRVTELMETPESCASRMDLI